MDKEDLLKMLEWKIKCFWDFTDEEIEGAVHLILLFPFYALGLFGGSVLFSIYALILWSVCSGIYELWFLPTALNPNQGNLLLFSCFALLACETLFLSMSQDWADSGVQAYEKLPVSSRRKYPRTEGPWGGPELSWKAVKNYFDFKMFCLVSYFGFMFMTFYFGLLVIKICAEQVVGIGLLVIKICAEQVVGIFKCGSTK
jgi:hypothetical protein